MVVFQLDSLQWGMMKGATSRTEWEVGEAPVIAACQGAGASPRPAGHGDEMTDLRPGTRRYIQILIAVATVFALMGVATTSVPTARELMLLTLFGTLLVLACRTPLPFGPGAHLLLDTTVVLAAVLMLPTGQALVVVGLGSLIGYRSRGADWIEAGFNAAQIVFQATAASVVLSWTGWWDRTDPFHDVTFVFAIVLAGLAMHLTNAFAVAGVIALDSRQRLWSVWRTLIRLNRTEAAGLISQWGLALLAAVVAETHVWALVLLVLPGAVVLGSLDRHARLRVRAEKALVHQAFHDALTGLPNRAALTRRLEEELAATAAEITLLFLDLDRFKYVNDTLGHEAGDHLLITVAARLTTCIREDEVVARLGGDEFVVMLVGNDPTPVQVAERIAESIAVPCVISGREVAVTASIGIAAVTRDGETPGELLRRADVALYRAKDLGRNRVSLYDTEMGTALYERSAMEGQLRAALKDGGLRLVFQPQVDLFTGQIVAREALVRWDHPELGELGPTAFLAVAEETGLIVPLGQQILADAFRAARSWLDATEDAPPVAINVSPRQVVDKSFFATIEQMLTTFDLPASQVRIEIGERAAMTDPDVTLSLLRRLSALGVGLVLDDFGDGQSSLTHLARFPVQVLALSRTLSALHEDGQDATVRAVVGLARELGFAVAAKGIERPEQAERLRELGCAIGQGHLYGWPQESVELSDRDRLIRQVA